MNGIINIQKQDGQLVVSSRQIAEHFEKEHFHVLRDIENLIGGISKNGDTYNHLFIAAQYQNKQNKQWYKEYLLTRDGFSLLVMGFTGKKALQWKLKYIEAFNIMEQKLKEQPKQLTPMEQLRLQYQVIEEHEEKINRIDNKIDELENNMPLFNIECKELQALVRKKGIEILGGKGSPAYKDNSVRGKVYSDIQHQLKREFGVTRYEAIKRSQLELAKEIVESYKTPIVLVDTITTLNNQMDIEEEM